MARAETPPSDRSLSTAPPAEWAVQVLEVTTRAWRLAPRSPQALARRAPYGYVPRRARLRAVAMLGLAHSW